MNQVHITSQLNFQEYLRANFYLTYRLPMLWLLTALGFVSLILFLQNLGSYDFSKSSKPLIQLAFGLYILVLMPLIIYFKTHKAFKTKNRSTEKMEWTFDPEWAAVKGESFETKMTWDKVHSVVETKEFFFIFQTKFMANILSKQRMGREQVQGFRGVVNGVLGMKKKLRTD